MLHITTTDPIEQDTGNGEPPPKKPPTQPNRVPTERDGK